MWDFLSSTPVQLTLGIVVLLILCFAAYQYVARLRDFSKDDMSITQEVARNFEEMRLGGDLSDAEFRNIQSVLGKKQTRDVSDAGNAT
jgi:uncharacterized membrane protein